MPGPNFEIQKLLFFLAQDSDEKLDRKIEQLVLRLSTARTWSVEPPVFVNEDHDGINTIGGYLTIYSALPPNELPTTLDRRNLEDVKELVRSLETFSGEERVAFELELDHVPVGSVEDGHIDETLRIGLILEWERVLAERETRKINDF